MAVQLTQSEKNYAKQVYDETGQALLGRETVEQFTEKKANEWFNAKQNGYIPSSVTFTQYLDKMYPKEKRTALKQRIASQASEIKAQDAEMAKRIEELKTKQSGGGDVSSGNKNLVWWILGGIGLFVLGFFGVKAFQAKNN
jgi:lysozyme family protein